MQTADPVIESISGFRLSPVQAALWRRDAPAFSRARLVIDGAITPEKLGEVIGHFARVNDGMRAAFRQLPGMDLPLQVVLERLEPVIVRESLVTCDDQAAEARMADAWQAAPDPDWAAGNLFWATLFDLPNGRQCIQFVAPAIVADAESLDMMLRQVDRHLRGEGLAEPGDIHYLHYSEWCHDNADGDGALEAREHWRRVHAERPALHLPFERDGRAGTHDEIERKCPPVSEAELLAAWVAVLGRYGDRRALTVYRRFHERPFAELADAVGPMSVDLPLPLRWSPDQSWPAWVSAVHDAIERADEARMAFDPERWPNGAEAIGFAWRTAAPGLDIVVEDASDAYCLALLAQAEGDGLQLKLRFNAARYALGQIERIADALVASLEAVDQAGAMSGFVRLGADERQMLDSWSRTTQAPPCEDTIHGRFAALARRQPDWPAVRTCQGEWSFRELDQRADAVAVRLAAIGAAGGRVALIAERSAQTIAAMLGILKAGAAFVPIDPASPSHRITRLIAAADVAAVLGALPADVSPAVPVLPLDCGDGDAGPVFAPPVAVSADAPAYVIFTSGSTGVPKGVVVAHRSAVNLAEALQERIYHDREGLTVSVNAPFSFDASIKQFVQLLNGHCLALIPEADRRDATALLDLIQALRIDVLDCTPSHLKLLFAAGFADCSADYPSIVLVGGEPIDAPTWTQLAAHPVTFWNVYGPTETTVNASVTAIDDATVPHIGRPLRNVQMRLVDEALKPVPIGVPGEILIGGTGVAIGYLHDAELTAQRFIPDPSGDPSGTRRAYRSGDRGVYDETGNLQFLGRIDDQVKIRGYRIEPGEVAAAVRAHPAIADAHVGAVEAGEGGRQLVAWYVQRNRAAAFRSTLLPTLAQINASETDYLFHEIFVDHAYGACGIRLPDDAVVFDVGANIGMFSLYVAQRCARPVIHAFEPIPAIYRALEINLARHLPMAVRHPIGLSAQAHDEPFTYYPGYSTMSGEARYADAAGEVAVIKTYLRNQRQAGDSAAAQEAEALLANADALLAERFIAESAHCRLDRLSDVIRRESIAMIDLLKIDVQRAELDVLLGIDDADWPKIQQIAMEVHDGADTPTQGRLDVLIDLLESRGFDVHVEQGTLLLGTDRFNLYAQRPDYVARLGDAGRLAADDDTVSEAELHGFLAERLPDYAIPAALIPIPALPLNSNGKVDRAALPLPGRDRRSGAVIEAPACDEERLMAEIWQEVLGLDRVGVNENFFQLGGDSIRSIQIQALAQKRGLSFSLPAIFRHQTIRELIRETGASLPATAIPGSDDAAFALISEADRARLPIGIEDAYPLAALQAAMLYHVALSGRATTYHNATAHEICAPLDRDALASAIAGAIASHAILRTSFDLESFSEALQLVHRDVAPKLTVHDLTGLGADQQRMTIQRGLESEAEQPFDFAAAPLLRFEAYRLADDRFVLAVAEFHGILDGWSLHLLIAELCRRYERSLAGELSPAAAPAVSFRRFVALERETCGSREAEDFWRRALAGATPVPLPRDGSEGIGHATRRLRIELPDQFGTTIQQAAHRVGVPLKSLLLAVHAGAMGQITGTADMLTGLVVNGRPQEGDGDRTLGLFINTVPFRLDLRRGESWAALARRAFAAEGALAAYRRMPLGHIQRLVGATAPLIDSLFNFTHFHGAPQERGQGSAIHRPYAHIAVDIDFPMSVDFELSPDTCGLNAYFQYEAADFSEAQVGGWAELYRVALMACAGDPDAEAWWPQRDAAGFAPSPLETRIAQIWQEALGIERVGRLQPFDALGGHSLLALRIRSRMARELDLDVPLDAFRSGVTVAALATLCAEARP